MQDDVLRHFARQGFIDETNEWNMPRKVRIVQESVDARAHGKNRLQPGQSLEETGFGLEAEHIVDLLKSVLIPSVDQHAHIGCGKRLVPIAGPSGRKNHEKIGARAHRTTLTRFLLPIKAIYFAAGLAGAATFAGAGAGSGAGESASVRR